MGASPQMVSVPRHWYNIIGDLPFDLPPDIQPKPRDTASRALKLQVPLELVRQSVSKECEIVIPDAVRERYLAWRPTPLVRARRLEEALGTKAHIYYKYEGGNVSGSHKLNTAIAQSYYYSKTGTRRLTTGTGAGQWGTALAAACQSFGMECKVYMVAASFRQKPYRKTIMKLLGADVVASPSADTASGQKSLRERGVDSGNIAFAVTEALEDALSNDGTQLSVGSGEAYSILHSTVIGLEAQDQFAALGAGSPDIVIASLGAGSNFGGIAFPFLRDRVRGISSVRCISVEPDACPKLTRGIYRYDYTDGSGITPLQKMYTLGHRFQTAGMHSGGLRYHACSKVISAVYHHGLMEATAYSQKDVFASATLFARVEGIVPAPEAAHAVHGAIREAERAREADEAPVILFCLSGHGLLDLAAYDEYQEGRMHDVGASEAEIRTSLEALPAVEEPHLV